MRMRQWVSLAIAGLLVWGMAAFSMSCQSNDRNDPEKVVRDSLYEKGLETGQQVFVAYCAVCHGEWGKGDGPLAAELKEKEGIAPARLNDREHLAALGRAELLRVIENGGEHTGRSDLMPPWGDRIDPALIEDVADFVMVLPEVDPGMPPATLQRYLEAPPGTPENGRKLYGFYCSICHGPEGKGNGYMADSLFARNGIRPRNLTDTNYMATKSDEDLFTAISLGGGHVRKSIYMPAWNYSLKPEQIKDLMSYVRAISGTGSEQ